MIRIHRNRQWFAIYFFNTIITLIELHFKFFKCLLH